MTSRFFFASALLAAGFVTLTTPACTTDDSHSAPPDPASLPPPSRALVVSYYPEGAAAGIEVLEAGGNAFDAFVATTLADFVVAPGVTALSGPLGAVTWDRRTKTAQYLDATYDDPSASDAVWHAGDPARGKGVLVPGAPAGLYAISQRYGRLPFVDVVKPAARLAREGFAISSFYASLVAYRADILKHTPYGARTFFRDGKPLAAGARLVQPELADFLDRFGKDGARAFYGGDFAKQLVADVGGLGGKMSEQDLSKYEPRWREPARVPYRNYVVYGTAGRTSGGFDTLLSLRVLAHHTFDASVHYSSSAPELGLLVRTSRALTTEPWLWDPKVLDDPSAVAEHLSPASADAIWARVASSTSSQSNQARRGSHSSAVAVVDSDGNAIAGTHTINDLPWGTGTFTQGIPLNGSGLLGDFNSVAPGQRRIMQLSMQLVVENEQVRFASSAFAASLLQSELQFLVNLLDYHLDPAAAVDSPRFGTYPYDATNPTALPDATKNYLDVRVDKSVVDALAAQGLSFVQQENADLGLGAVAAIAPDGTMSGGIAPLTGFDTRGIRAFIRP